MSLPVTGTKRSPSGAKTALQTIPRSQRAWETQTRSPVSASSAIRLSLPVSWKMVA
jgi:hypothetical protein